MTRAEAKAWREKLSALVGTLDDETALSNAALFESWRPGEAVAVGTVRRVGEDLYRCVQAHTAQPDWLPPDTPALWTRISLEAWPDWTQPVGAQDAYQTGAQVTFDGAHWVSTCDNNVWRPGVYGWEAE